MGRRSESRKSLVRCLHYVCAFTTLMVLLSCGTSNKALQTSKYQIFTLSASATNVYLIVNKERILLIDTGLPGDHEKLIEKIKALGLNPNKIEYVILTHGHHDHAGNASYLQQTFRSKIIAGSADSTMIRQGLNDHLCPTSTWAKLLKGVLAEGEFDSFEPDIQINTPQDLSELGWDLIVTPVPGHTPGSLIIEAQDVVFVGDLIRGQALNSSNPATHYFICDEEDNKKDIGILLQKDHLKKWLPGHYGALDRADVLHYFNRK